ncbi:MAG: SCP-2 sterol transfer family protein [Candidatus Methanolliviera sp. GoM_asphalt]|nr:MAG: SCP-2 sterol transfer family protein [Candidatus Methanolliviera sp. GoM_asphalt]
MISGYAGVLLWGTFAIMSIVSLIARNPFTLQHAKEQVIEAVWETPAFISLNYLLTGIFAAVFSINLVISALWNNSLIILPISFALLGVALALTMVLPSRYVLYYMKKRGVNARPKDLGKLPLKTIFMGMVAGFDEEKAELIIKANREDWVAIAEGKLDGTRAFMEEKLKIEGDMNDLFKMQSVFRQEE